MRSRDITGRMVSFFDNLVPPLLRDQRWFMFPFFKTVCGNSAKAYMNFKEKYFDYSQQEIEELYGTSSGRHSVRATDLNDKSIVGILKNVIGQNVLDVACGKGFLSHLLANNGFNVVACDFLNTLLPQFEHPNIEFIQGDITSLNFADGQFDTVISAHTLEHVEDIFSAVHELRRIAKKRLILVLPKQRPCKFTFDFHIHFFPYSVTLLSVLGARGRNYKLDLLGGDWFYVEEIQGESG